MKISTVAAGLVFALLMGCGAEDSSFEGHPTEADEQELATGCTARVTTNPSPVVVGAPTLLAVRVTGPRAAPIKQFDLLHTQAIHLIAVSSDLEDFIHVHPVLQPAGKSRAPQPCGVQFGERAAQPSRRVRRFVFEDRHCRRDEGRARRDAGRDDDGERPRAPRRPLSHYQRDADQRPGQLHGDGFAANANVHVTTAPRIAATQNQGARLSSSGSRSSTRAIMAARDLEK